MLGPRFLPVALFVLVPGLACDDESAPPTVTEGVSAEPEAQSAEEAPAPAAPPEALPPLAPEDFEAPCLAAATGSRGDVPIPPQLTELVGDTHADSSLVRLFAREGRVPPTAAGHTPTGHVFRWTFREAIAEPRARFPNDEFRARLAVLAGGVPLQEGFENRQVRTLEVRLRTRGPVEQVLTVLNSKAEDRPSTAAQSCVDHGMLPDLTIAHFARWGWLPPELAELAERVPEGRVLRLRTTPAEAVLRGGTAIEEALEDWDGAQMTLLDDGAVRISASADAEGD